MLHSSVFNQTNKMLIKKQEALKPARITVKIILLAVVHPWFFWIMFWETILPSL